MKRQQVWLRMEDQNYEKKLYSFLNHHYGNVMELHRYDECSGGTSPARECLFLTDSDEDDSFGRRIPLTLGESDDGIDLYQSGHSIAQQILERVEREMQAEVPVLTQSFAQEVMLPQNTEGDGKMLSVYSPVGGSGKTSFAITLAQCLMRIGNGKVLYLNLEGASDWQRYFNAPSAYNFSDLLYNTLMKLEEGRMQEQLEKMVHQQANGVFFIRPCTSFEDLSVLTAEELRQLIRILKKAFSWIICDMNTAFHGVNRIFMTESCRCFLMKQSRPGARMKIRDFMDSLEICEGNAEDWRRHLTLVEWGRRKEKEGGCDYWLPEERDIFFSKDRLFYPDENTDYYQRVMEIAREEVWGGGHMAGKVSYV